MKVTTINDPRVPPRELLKCKICGKENQYDSWADKNLNTYHDGCAPKDRWLIQVSQHSVVGRQLKVNFEHIRYKYNRVVLDADIVYKGIQGILMWPVPVFTYKCWVLSGQAYPIEAEEIADIQKFGVEKFMSELSRRTEHGLAKCTHCHRHIHVKDGKAVRFADFLCSKCLANFNNETENQRKNGNVCSMCGQPRNNCYC